MYRKILVFFLISIHHDKLPPPADLPSTPIITTLPTSIIATSPHLLDISRSQISSPNSVVITNPPLVRVPIPSTSDFIGTHTASNSNRVTSATSTDPHSAALPQIHPSPIKPPCHFYMQESCKHSKRGSNCPFSHLPMFFKFIGKGSKGCDKGSLCTYAHPKLCQASVFNRRCNRKICNFYHVSGSLRPNHPGTAFENHSYNKLEKITDPSLAD